MEKEYINEGKMASLVGISSRTLLRWRQKNLIPSSLFEKKVSEFGRISIIYNAKLFKNWYLNKS